MGNLKQAAARASKSVEQIEQDWRAIEAKLSDERLHNIGNVPQEMTGEATDEEERLLEIIDVLNDVVAGYHNEMGVLLNALTAAQAERGRLRHALEDLMVATGPVLQKSHPKSAWAEAWNSAELVLNSPAPPQQ